MLLVQTGALLERKRIAVQQFSSSECESCLVCRRAHCASRLLHCLHWKAGDMFTASWPLPPLKMKYA